MSQFLGTDERNCNFWKKSFRKVILLLKRWLFPGSVVLLEIITRVNSSNHSQLRAWISTKNLINDFDFQQEILFVTPGRRVMRLKIVIKQEDSRLASRDTAAVSGTNLQWLINMINITIQLVILSIYHSKRNVCTY